MEWLMKRTRVDRKFAELKKQGKKAFIAYLSAGDLNLEDTIVLTYFL